MDGSVGSRARVGVIRVSRRAVLVASVVGLTGAGRPVAHGVAQEAAIDPAALVLRPADVSSAGWRHDGAFYDDLDAVAHNESDYLDEAVASGDVAAKLQAAGFRRFYSSAISLTPANATQTARRVRSYVTEYETAEGAAAGFALLEDETGVATAKDIAGTRTFGEQSELTRDQGVSATEGRPYRSLDLTFRSGSRVAGVTVIAYGDRTPEPSTGEVEALAAIVEERLSAPPAGAAPLGASAIRLEPGGGRVVSYDDAYYRLAGEDVPLTDETTSAANWRIASYGTATDVYQLWQGTEAAGAGGFVYGATLLRFPDSETAAGWLEKLPELLGTNPFYAKLAPLAEAPALGEQSLALGYVAGGKAGTPRATLVALRVGADVARLHLVPQGRTTDMPLAAATALAGQAAGCLGGTCPVWVAVPAELAGT